MSLSCSFRTIPLVCLGCARRVVKRAAQRRLIARGYADELAFWPGQGWILL